MLVYLNRNIPQLEESSELLLKPTASLNLLQQLQVNKLKENIAHAATVHPVNKKLKRSLLILLLSVIVSALIFLLLNPLSTQLQKNIVPRTTSTTPRHVLPAIASLHIKNKITRLYQHKHANTT